MRGKSKHLIRLRLDFHAETRKSANYDFRFDISADFAVSESAQARYKSASFAGFLARDQPGFPDEDNVVEMRNCRAGRKKRR
jgi:hypothetical protein